MNIKQLEAFAAIARFGSFAVAADRLNLTQSTISVRIKELEQDLGVALFDRSRRQVQLTPKGRELLDYAERAIALQLEIRRRIGTAEALSGVVRIGVVELIAITWLPRLAAMLHARYPALTLEFEVALNPSLLSWVRCGDIDVALVAGAGAEAGLPTRHLGTVRFAWMVGAAFDLPRRTVTPEDIRQWPVILQGTDSYMSQLVAATLQLGGRARRNGTSCNSLAALVSLTMAGAGVSLMPLETSERDIREGRLRVLPMRPPHVEIGFTAVCATPHPSPAIEALMDLAVDASTFQR
jgi:DNA-binding transcriptional LysR family regulator